MTTPVENAILCGHRANCAVAGGSITYHRGNILTTLDATFGRTEMQSETGQVVRLEYTYRDFIVASADLAFGAEKVTPKKGDKIIVLETHEVFEVLPLRTSPAFANQTTPQCFRACDPNGTLIRIHAKKVNA